MHVSIRDMHTHVNKTHLLDGVHHERPPDTGELRVWRVVAVFALTGMGTGGAALLQAKRLEGPQSDAHAAKRTAAIACGLQAGVCFGLSAASCKVGTRWLLMVSGPCAHT